MPPENLQSESTGLYYEHAPGLLRYGVALAGNRDMANDALQETFLRYYTERRFGRHIENPRAWMYQVMRNYLLDRFRSAAPFREIDGETLTTLADPSVDPERMVHRAQIAGQIAASLSARESECLRLRAEGMSYLEIAEAMNLRPGTVGALLARANRKIRRAAGRSLLRDCSIAGAIYHLYLQPENRGVPSAAV